MIVPEPPFLFQDAVAPAANRLAGDVMMPALNLADFNLILIIMFRSPQ